MKSPINRNVETKREYLLFVKEALGRSTTTLDKIAAAIDDYRTFTDDACFATFDDKQAAAFKAHEAKRTSPKTGKPLSKPTLSHKLKAVKAFFQWIADEPRYRAHVRRSHAEYLNLSLSDERIADAGYERPVATLDQIRQMIDAMPSGTPMERRDRAVVVFSIVTGARDGVTCSTLLKHIDIEGRTLAHDPREQKVKFSKTYKTVFFPVGEDLEAILADWVRELVEIHGFGPDDPLFPQTEVKPRRQICVARPFETAMVQCFTDPRYLPSLLRGS